MPNDTRKEARQRDRAKPSRPAQRQAGAPKPARRHKPAARKPEGPKPSVSRHGEPRTGEAMRIAKAMARAGLCSRREAERWIADGRVSVNGKLLDTPACEVSDKDRVLVDGKPLPTAEAVRLWRYYKPKGLVTTHKDPQGRPTVFASLPPELPRVISVGRLDFNSEGLLLLTNSGELARHLELPATGWLRRYRVRAHGRVAQDELDALQNGVEVEGVHYGPIEATIDSVQGANAWLTVALREGKNREVRRILAHLGLDVNRLIRVSYGPFQLLDMKPGEVEGVKRRVLAEQLGKKLADELGLTGEQEAERLHRKAAHKATPKIKGGAAQ